MNLGLGLFSLVLCHGLGLKAQRLIFRVLEKLLEGYGLRFRFYKDFDGLGFEF
jgi:hypothetical protein